jgi:DNA-binding MarR family transcriptional regulator
MSNADTPYRPRAAVRKTLITLYEQGAQHACDLSKMIGVRQHALPEHLDTAQKAGMVARFPRGLPGKRSVVWHLTAAGAELAEQLVQEQGVAA